MWTRNLILSNAVETEFVDLSVSKLFKLNYHKAIMLENLWGKTVQLTSV